MRYSLNDIHAEAIKVAVVSIGPITLLNLVKRLKEEKICSDLDDIMYICQLQKLIEQGKIDKNLILKSTGLSGLTNNQKIAIKEIVEKVKRDNESLSFLEIADQCCKITGEGDPEDVVRKIKFLMIPLTSEHSNDDTNEEDES